LVKRALFGARGKGKKGLGANFQYGFGFHNSTQNYDDIFKHNHNVWK
jgi:hypothetical protein